VPGDVLALFPAGATVVDSKSIGTGPSGTLAVLAALPGGPAPAGGPPPPPAAELAIAIKVPAGWRLSKAVIQAFAQVPSLAVAAVDQVPAAGMAYHTGANSQGLLVVRDAAVVYDGVADSVQLKDLDNDGTAEVIKSWSPFCQSHAASPRIDTVYAWDSGQYVAATGKFPQVLSGDIASFQAALTRANSPQTTPVWTAGAKGCLHDALAYLDDLSGNSAQADAERAQVRQLDATYDPDAIKKAAAGEPAHTNPS